MLQTKNRILYTSLFTGWTQGEVILIINSTIIITNQNSFSLSAKNGSDCEKETKAVNVIRYKQKEDPNVIFLKNNCCNNKKATEFFS